MGGDPVNNLNILRMRMAGVECTPQAVPSALIQQADAWREACRCSLELSQLKLSYRTMAEIGGFIYPHVPDWFNGDDRPTRRSLPARCINVYEREVVGNTFLTQWLAWRSGLTVVEEMQANMHEQRKAA